MLDTVLSILKFWNSVVWFVKLLKETPAEKHQEIQIKINLEFENFKQTGRPKWS